MSLSLKKQKYFEASVIKMMRDKYSLFSNHLISCMTNMCFQIGLYRFFLFCSLPYNIAGAVMTGTRGICSDMEDCVYQENYAVNLAMAISITALHGFSFFHALMISSKSSQTENEVRQSS